MFSYIGGKYRQAKWISKYVPKDIDTYAEVFGGAMWTYVNGKVEANNIHYNDFNTQMANLLYCCSEFEKFIPFLDSRKAQIGAEEFNRCKSDVLDVINSGNVIQMPDFELAAKYVYIITQCFSGIMSEKVKYVDLKGKYNSKYNSFSGRVKNKKVQKKLEKIKVVSQSFEDFIPSVDDFGSFLYVDPPY